MAKSSFEPPWFLLLLPLLLICVCSIAASTRFQEKPGVKVFSIPCTISHAHRATDYRIALVKVLEVTTCGFTYEDLEEHAVAAEGISTDLGLFQLGSVQFESKLMTVRLVRADVQKGAFGVLVYCTHCRAGCLMRMSEVSK